MGGAGVSFNRQTMISSTLLGGLFLSTGPHREQSPQSPRWPKECSGMFETVEGNTLFGR